MVNHRSWWRLMIDRFTVRELRSFADLEAMKVLEQTVWGSDGTPSTVSYSTNANGGISLGAFEGERLVAFSYSLPGFIDGNTYLYSKRLGVNPRFRRNGLGALLKRKQRELAQQKGYQTICWTFDPLETGCANLNIHILGARGLRYLENCFGMMDDSLNKGLPTDRIWTQLRLNHSKPWSPETRREERQAYGYYLDRRNWPIPHEWGPHPSLQGDLLIKTPVPNRFQNLKIEDPALASLWRAQTRNCFQYLFNNGYVAVDFVMGPVVGEYVFVKSDLPAPDSEKRKDQNRLVEQLALADNQS